MIFRPEEVDSTSGVYRVFGPSAQGNIHLHADSGRTIGDIRAGLKIACKGSKIAYGQKAEGGFIFHDLRRCFTSYARRAGVPKNVIEAIQGHSNAADMNARYDIVEDHDLLSAVDKMADFFSATRTLPVT
jgi:integrase